MLACLSTWACIATGPGKRVIMTVVFLILMLAIASVGVYSAWTLLTREITGHGEID